MPAAPFPSEAFLVELRAALERAAAKSHETDPRYAVALSGGLDSTVLLAGVARLEPRPSVRALHVDHGLHPDSAGWERRCAAFAAALGVPYRSVRVEVDRAGGAGLEAAAREARYAALASLLGPGEILLTAHHADDQLETLVHRLVRGTGVRGLRGVLPHARLEPGFLARPLLGVERAAIRAQAERWGLAWLEDPSNRALDYDRNYLRAEVLPPLRRRWPHAALAAARLAESAADAEEILAAAAEADLASCGGADRPSAAAIAALSPARRRNALRHAIRAAGASMPTARQLETLAEALRSARADARLCVRWPGGEARVHRGRLHVLAPAAFPPGVLAPRALARTEASALSAPQDARLSPSQHAAPAPTAASRLSSSQPWTGPEGRLSLERARESGLPDSVVQEGLEVRFRRGGERFRPEGSAHHRKLKVWFQEQGIVPWMRDRVPLLYWRDRLVAVADLAVSADLPAAPPTERRWRVRWDDHPAIR
ncbi:MAG TPA: tRNA lysidine(34) synthetase TilS [Gammaproteobacteria bacterium]|nr:tRNA lysidine(34) synthetase TilS [Gammaproteobacteria bacterium]